MSNLNSEQSSGRCLAPDVVANPYEPSGFDLSETRLLAVQIVSPRLVNIRHLKNAIKRCVYAFHHMHSWRHWYVMGKRGDECALPDGEVHNIA